jgi:uncharacterized DUF497 family protein
MKYEWDDAKNRKNFVKHGLRFEEPNWSLKVRA